MLHDATITSPITGTNIYTTIPSTATSARHTQILTDAPPRRHAKERTISSPRSTRHPLSHIYSRHPLPEIRRRVPMESVRQRHTTMGTRSPHPYTSSSNLSLSVRRLSLSSRSESRSRRKVISINSRCSIPSRRSYDVNHSKASCTERCM